MEEENKVSVWIGNFNSVAEFKKYVEEAYDDDGEMTSPFLTDFEIDYYDEDLKEAEFSTDANKKELLEGFSYSENFISQIPAEALENSNSYLFLYNFEYDETVNKKGNFSFIGTYDYNNYS